MATSPRDDQLHASKGYQVDLDPVDPRLGLNTQYGKCTLVAYCDNGGIREADGSYDTHPIWGGQGVE